MLRRPTVAGALLIAAILAVACGDKAGPPTSPTGRGADRDRAFLAISGCDESTAFRCRATVRRGDVAVQEVTHQAAWSTNNPTAATIAEDGQLTAVTGGAVVITATHQGMMASRQAQLPAPARVELQGRVEDFYEWWVKVPGATIEFVQGPNTGRVAVTDANGFYSFPDLWPTLGGQVVRISHPRYRTGDFWPGVWDHRPVNQFNPRLTPLAGAP